MSSGRKCYERETLPYTPMLDYLKAEESSQVQFGTGSNLLRSVRVFIQRCKFLAIFPNDITGWGKGENSLEKGS